jgi:L-ribulose-5-phosphate 3-epimerase
MQHSPCDRRGFLKRTGQLGAGMALGGLLPASVLAAPAGASPPAASKAPLYKISLAQWSLHRTIFSGKLDNLDFARTANDFGIGAIEYVNQFFKDKARDRKYLAELKKRARENGVASLLIMIDGEGNLGDPDDAKRGRAVENHRPWIEAAAYLGCHSLRVNAASSGSYDEQVKLAADGLRRLSEIGDEHGLDVIVENHGGLSSNGAWLAKVMETVAHPRCGTLPDFGNFNLGGGKTYDRYQGVKELMPYARAVSAKSHDFDEAGNEKHTDYRKMMKIVVDAGYRGYVGIEYEGRGASEAEGIVLTQRLLEKVRDELSAA